MINALTIDVEDYYPIFARDHMAMEMPVGPDVVRSTAVITDMLAARGIKATFFILGEVAAAHPQLAPSLAAAGHEIGVHGYHHRQVFKLTRQEFADEIRSARKLLEDQTGRDVKGHRAPAFSIGPDTQWALDVLAEEGFRYDSSIFPIRGRRYGWPGFGPAIRRVPLAGGRSIIEAPLSTLSVLGKKLPVCGGGYLRHFPLWFTRWAFGHIAAKRPVIVYMHPYETDADAPPAAFQAALDRSPDETRRFHCGQLHNRATVAGKLASLLDSFSFAPLGGVIDAALEQAGPMHQA